MTTAQNRQKPDNSQFLTKLNYRTVTGEFKNMVLFRTDCFVYMFRRPMTEEQQMQFMEFIRDSDKLNNTTLTEFINWFLSHDILFDVMFEFVNRKDMTLPEMIQYNWTCLKLTRKARKILNRLYKQNNIPACCRSLFFHKKTT